MRVAGARRIAPSEQAVNGAFWYLDHHRQTEGEAQESGMVPF